MLVAKSRFTGLLVEPNEGEDRWRQATEHKFVSWLLVFRPGNPSPELDRSYSVDVTDHTACAMQVNVSHLN